MHALQKRVAALFVLVGFAAASTSAQSDSSTLPIQDGDTVVVAGDSITVSGLYERLVDCWFQTHFPSWRVRFRNAGVNGYRADLGLQVIEEDVLAWKPTVVLINYGMNDGRAADGCERYIKHIVPYVEKARSGGARIILCSNSPIDIGDKPGLFTDFNANFARMAQFAAAYAAKEGLLFVDQFHPLHDLWGHNRERETWIAVTWQSGTPDRPNDSVHPAPPGHLTMAYTILKGLGVPGEVSYASIDTATRAVETRRCVITDLKVSGREVSFTRTDEAAPGGVEDAALPGNELVPFLAELNSMPLKVRGLPDGEYEVSVNDHVLTTASAPALAAGINLGLFPQSPIYAPGNQSLRLIRQRLTHTEAARAVMRFRPPPWLRVDQLDAQRAAQWQRLNEQVWAADDAIHAAAQPRPLAFRIAPVK